VATITLFAAISCPSTHTRNGRREKSTRSTSWSRISVPKRSACARISAMRSGPMIPSRKPGKFSTSVVVMSCPPGW
jgi:hypothetical protein